MDVHVQALLNRPLEFSRHPYVHLVATYLHVRGPARKLVICRVVIVADGITSSGQREFLGIEVGASEYKALWTVFLRLLKERGLTVVRLAISDAHAGLKTAIARCFQGCGWQCSRVSFFRNSLVKVPKASHDMVAAALRSVVVQQEARAVAVQWE
jgi:putative transposase